ncbi:hypothetical protein [Zavarzinella formosa]|nr:hypothetical protein [Zavarzinella formosa]
MLANAAPGLSVVGNALLAGIGIILAVVVLWLGLAILAGVHKGRDS